MTVRPAARPLVGLVSGGWFSLSDMTNALLQELTQAFTQGERYTLTELEVEAVYLSLVRLADLEKFGAQRDWEAIEAYCPQAGG